MKPILSAILLTAAAAIPFHVGTAFAQSADPSWLDDLKEQIAIVEQCG